MQHRFVTEAVAVEKNVVMLTHTTMSLQEREEILDGVALAGQALVCGVRTRVVEMQHVEMAAQAEQRRVLMKAFMPPEVARMKHPS
jgi:hypothetical protein